MFIAGDFNFNIETNTSHMADGSHLGLLRIWVGELAAKISSLIELYFRTIFDTTRAKHEQLHPPNHH
jgi:hypothetical protein